MRKILLLSFLIGSSAMAAPAPEPTSQQQYRVVVRQIHKSFEIKLRVLEKKWDVLCDKEDKTKAEIDAMQELRIEIDGIRRRMVELRRALSR